MAKQEKGGVALEYILVSTFAAVATTLVLGVLATIAKKKVSKLAEKFDVDAEFTGFDAFED